MPGRTVAAIAATVFIAWEQVHAVSWQTPRATNTMPVSVLVECLSSSCDVAEHCATPDNWIGVTEADFRQTWSLEERQVISTPMRSNGRHLCAVAAREGEVALTGFRYYRVRGADNAWVMRSMTRDWAFRDWAEIGTGASADLAPANAYWFYKLVKGRELCFDGCGAGTDTLYFQANDQAYARIEQLAPFTMTFTLFATQGTFEGEWLYEQTRATAGTVELQFFDDQLDDTCWLDLTFDTETSGTFSNRCRASEGGTGTWEIQDRP